MTNQWFRQDSNLQQLVSETSASAEVGLLNHSLFPAAGIPAVAGNRAAPAAPPAAAAPGLATTARSPPRGIMRATCPSRPRSLRPVHPAGIEPAASRLRGGSSSG